MTTTTQRISFFNGAPTRSSLNDQQNQLFEKLKQKKGFQEFLGQVDFDRGKDLRFSRYDHSNTPRVTIYLKQRVVIKGVTLQQGENTLDKTALKAIFGKDSKEYRIIQQLCLDGFESSPTLENKNQPAFSPSSVETTPENTDIPPYKFSAEVLRSSQEREQRLLAALDQSEQRAAAREERLLAAWARSEQRYSELFRQLIELASSTMALQRPLRLERSVQSIDVLESRIEQLEKAIKQQHSQQQAALPSFVQSQSNPPAPTVEASPQKSNVSETQVSSDDLRHSNAKPTKQNQTQTFEVIPATDEFKEASNSIDNGSDNDETEIKTDTEADSAVASSDHSHKQNPSPVISSQPVSSERLASLILSPSEEESNNSKAELQSNNAESSNSFPPASSTIPSYAAASSATPSLLSPKAPDQNESQEEKRPISDGSDNDETEIQTDDQAGSSTTFEHSLTPILNPIEDEQKLPSNSSTSSSLTPMQSSPPVIVIPATSVKTSRQFEMTPEEVAKAEKKLQTLKFSIDRTKIEINRQTSLLKKFFNSGDKATIAALEDELRQLPKIPSFPKNSEDYSLAINNAKKIQQLQTQILTNTSAQLKENVRENVNRLNERIDLLETDKKTWDEARTEERKLLAKINHHAVLPEEKRNSRQSSVKLEQDVAQILAARDSNRNALSERDLETLKRQCEQAPRFIIEVKDQVTQAQKRNQMLQSHLHLLKVNRLKRQIEPLEKARDAWKKAKEEKQRLLLEINKFIPSGQNPLKDQESPSGLEKEVNNFLAKKENPPEKISKDLLSQPSRLTQQVMEEVKNVQKRNQELQAHLGQLKQEQLAKQQKSQPNLPVAPLTSRSQINSTIPHKKQPNAIAQLRATQQVISSSATTHSVAIAQLSDEENVGFTPESPIL